jgi:hypothetical protein
VCVQKFKINIFWEWNKGKNKQIKIKRGSLEKIAVKMAAERLPQNLDRKCIGKKINNEKDVANAVPFVPLEQYPFLHKYKK